ncbi:MAG: sugar phosphate isomerase/epimerase [Tannerella sp.]|jgi:sugar phosphate isomerase/epimerase|nr:sugar phosphate isomerase/epimerase [Tannerella sp.]
MVLDRRNFLKAAAVTAGGAALSACGGNREKAACCKEGESACCKKGESACCKGKKEVKLNLSFQESTPPGASLNEKFDFMEKLGVTGFEPGGGGLAGRVKEIRDALNGRNIKVSAICAGFKGFILSEDADVRRQCIDTMHEIIAAAGELESTGVIIVPAFNSQTQAKPHTQETRDFLCEQMDLLGTFAAQHNTTVILEPLNRKEAFYLRLLADAASICRDINNPGVRCLGDFWHMTWEETCDTGAFLSAGKYLQHVHMASRKNRAMPGEDGEADNYVAGFKGLKMIGYDKYVSFECGCRGEDRAAAATTAVQLLRDQWEQA